MAGAPPSQRDDLLLVGTIGLPFGIKGQVKLHSITSRPEHLRRVKKVFVGPGQVEMGLVRAAEHKHGIVLLTLHGIADRDAAAALRGAEVYIHQDDAAPLEADEYFLHDLPGLEVVTAGGEEIGTVRDVLETGANEVLVVDRRGGGEVLIPIIRDIVKTLDIPGQRVVIEPMEGLFE